MPDPTQRMPVSTEFKALDGSGLRRRAYRDYDEYLAHQREKLGVVGERIGPSDLEYEEILLERLLSIPHFRARHGVAPTAICLGARLGGEVRAMKRLGVLAVGIDVQPGPDNPHVLHGDFHDLQFPDASFDLAFTNALDHVWDLDRVAAEVWRVLKPGGVLYVELGAGAPRTYESVDTSDPGAVLAILGRRFEEVSRTSIHNKTSYVDWQGHLIALRRRDQAPA